jgi:hypothetical protein
MRKAATLISVFALFLAVSSNAAAQSSGGSDSRVSLTISTLNLAKPIISDESIEYSPEIELMGEVNINDKFGVAGIANFGRAKLVDFADPLDLNIAKFGLQGAYYPIGHFGHGMQLGVQAMRTQVFGSGDVQNIDLQAAANATSLAGFIGYKIISEPGFTFVAQAGGGPRFISAVASSDQNSESSSGVAPKIIVNLNAGWSF